MLVIFELQTHIIQELRRRRSSRLQVPSFIEGRMMAGFDDTSVKVDVDYVFIGGSVA